MPEDFYDLLGVDSDASDEELKRAYRKLAREYHPDVNDDERASDQFKTVRRVYEVLSNRAERSAYDRLGHREYVSKRMDGFSPLADDESTGDDERTSSGSGTNARPDSGTASAEPSRSRSAYRSSESSWAGGSATSATASSAAESNDGAGSSTARSASRRSSERAGRRSTERRRSRSPSSTMTGGTTTMRDRRSALRWRWTAVAAALVVYLAGLAQYGTANRSALSAFVDSLRTAPAVALRTDVGLSAPLAFVVDAAAGPSAALLFPVGAVMLPVVLGVTVAQFGRGGAWLYPLGTLAPAVFIVGHSSLPLPGAAAVDVAALGVVPALAAFGFLVDVGRYLVATR